MLGSTISTWTVMSTI